LFADSEKELQFHNLADKYERKKQLAELNQRLLSLLKERFEQREKREKEKLGVI